MPVIVVAIVVFLAVMGVARAGPLHDAAEKGEVAAVERLLDAGTDVDEPGRNAETPLVAAALAGQIATAELLIERGADVMARNRGGFTPLHAAAYSGNAEIARLLLDHGAKLEDRKNVSGATPLILAAEENRVEAGKLLISRGADVSIPDRDGFTALTGAWTKGQTEMVRLLKENGAECQSAEKLGAPYRQKCLEATQ